MYNQNVKCQTWASSWARNIDSPTTHVELHDHAYI